MGHWFIYILITLDAFAALSYLWQGDLARTVYWSCAGALTSTTLYMK